MAISTVKNPRNTMDQKIGTNQKTNLAFLSNKSTTKANLIEFLKLP
jgi:hypothetical protein